MDAIQIIQLVGSFFSIIIVLVTPLATLAYNSLKSTAKDQQEKIAKLEAELDTLSDKINQASVSNMEVWGKINVALAELKGTLQNIHQFMIDSREIDKRQDREIEKIKEQFRHR